MPDKNQHLQYAVLQFIGKAHPREKEIRADFESNQRILAYTIPESCSSTTVHFRVKLNKLQGNIIREETTGSKKKKNTLRPEKIQWGPK